MGAKLWTASLAGGLIFTDIHILKLLKRFIVKKLPEGLSRVFFSDNGSTAVEVALKMAYQSAGKSKSTASEIYCF